MAKAVSHTTVADATFSAAGVAAWDAVHTLTDIAALSANTFTALQTITQATANAGILASTGYSLTGSDATSMIDLAGTWNTTGTPTALKLDITNTASNAASLLMDLQVGSASKFQVGKDGSMRAGAGLLATPSWTYAGDSDTGFYNRASGRSTYSADGAAVGEFYSGGFNFSAGIVLGWCSASVAAAGADVGISRLTGSTLAIGNSAQGSFVGSLKLTNLTAVGGTTLGYVAKTGTYGVAATDYTVDCTSGTFTVTLETATTAGQIHNIKNTGTGIITIATTSAQTIDDGASGSITLAQYDNLTVQSDGANWIIL